MYTAPVEINVYDNNVALIAFGQSQMAIVIQSPAIAMCFRQMFEFMFAFAKNYSDKEKTRIINQN